MKLPVSTSPGRPCRCPANEASKAVKKEKLFEHQKMELWLRTLVTEKLKDMAPDAGASFFLLGFWRFVSRSGTGTAKDFCFFSSKKKAAGRHVKRAKTCCSILPKSNLTEY
jgi:hypothetical protein